MKVSLPHYSAAQWTMAAIITMSVFSLSAADSAYPVDLSIVGEWRVKVSGKDFKGRTYSAEIQIPKPDIVKVRDELYERLPDFTPQMPEGWQKGLVLRGLRAQECAGKGALEPASLEIRDGDKLRSILFEKGKDYEVDKEWGTIGRLPEGRIKPNQAVFASYHYYRPRIDAIALAPYGIGVIRLHKGAPDIATPLPPETPAGELRLANIFIPGKIDKLRADNLFPLLETAPPEPPKPTPSVAERLLPKTIAKLRNGERLRILAWGDSVTDGGYLPNKWKDSWQNQFLERLRQQFPAANIVLTTEAWPGHTSSNYLTVPPGAVHNYKEKVLAQKPDLIISEFVNDAGLTPAQVAVQYGRFLKDFKESGTEWIIFTPHYISPDRMGLSTQREIDNDPRPYVQALREFSAKNGVPLADASRRWGRLWRQGIPYSTMLLNTINHPDPRGMRLFTDSIMPLFPQGGPSPQPK